MNLIDTIKKHINHYWVLFLIITIAYLINYSPNTYLIGWDSLQVELNPLLNIKRNWSAVWQEYQGLGIVSGNAHAVEALRSVIVLFFTILLPDELVRYLIHYLYLLIGVFLAYKLFRKLNVQQNASFLGALFYFLNIGTAQVFYVPFEPFSAFFAFLPLSLYWVFNILESPRLTLKQVLLFLGTLILLTFAFQVPTLFVVFSFLLIFITLGKFLLYLYKNRKLSLSIFSRATLIWTSFIIINLFWLLPFLYSLGGNIEVRNESLATRLSSENVIYESLSYANWTDIALLRGFWYSNVDYRTETEAFGYMMQPWVSWLDVPGVVFLGYAFAFLVLIGAFISIFKRKTGAYIFIPTLFLSLFFLFGSAGITGELYDSLVYILPPIGEAFRFAFTKWVTPLCLSFAFFVGISFEALFVRINNGNFKKIVLPVIVTIIAGLMVYYAFPYFSGNMFYDYNKERIPAEYSRTIEYFKNEPENKRIAMLPANSIWGWYFTDWNYRGSGFIWYGIPQSIMSRTFDVWSLKNEQFYREFQYAIYSEDPELLTFVLNKYQINYLLLDKNIIEPNANESLFYEETQELLSKINNIILDSEFGDSIVVYKTELDQPANKYIYAPENFKITDNTYTSSNIDSNYISENPTTLINLNNKTNDYKVSYPFAEDTFITENLSDDNELVINNPFPGEKKLKIPPFNVESRYLIKADLLESNYIGVEYLFPEIYTNDRRVFSANENSSYPLNIGQDTNYSVLIGNEILNPENSSINTYITDNSFMRVFNNSSIYTQNFGEEVRPSIFYDCAGASGGKSTDGRPNSIKIFSEDNPACVRFLSPVVSNFDTVYKVSFDYKNIEGSSIRYCLRDKITDECVNETYKSKGIPSTDYNKFTDYVFVPSGKTLDFELIADPEDPELDYYEVSAKDIIVETHEVIRSVPIIEPFFLENEDYRVTLNDSNFPLRIVLPEVSSTHTKYTPGDGAYNPDARNCDRFNQTDFGRAFNSKTNTFEYYALSAVSCDNIQSDFINPNDSYLITFDSNNIVGKGLDICVVGQSLEKCLIQDRLNGTGKESFVLPRYPAADNVSVYLENQSIGKFPTRNKLSGISVKNIPYFWLKGLKIENSDNSGNSIQNPIEVSSVRKTLTYKYDLELQAIGPGSGLIVLNQAYEKGWNVYNKNTCKFGLITPFTCDMVKGSSHVLAKNWANSWVLPSSDANYVVIYWPQYLQFLGYFASLIWISMWVSSIAFRRTP